MELREKPSLFLLSNIHHTSLRGSVLQLPVLSDTSAKDSVGWPQLAE